MRSVRGVLFVLALFLSSPNVDASSISPGAHNWPSTLQVGDYVVYRVRRADNAVRIELRKEVIDKHGDRAVVDVIAWRGNQRRHWIEIVPHVLRDVKPAIVFELSEIGDGSRVHVAARDIDRLYEWIPAMPSSVVMDSARYTVSLEGWTFECDRASGNTVWAGSSVNVSSTICEQFPWGRWEHSLGNEHATIAAIEVVEAGRGGYSQVRCAPGTTL
ncbi:MAG: hypothetical protein AB7P03_24395 [Kofleriaceae bacterium]